MMADNLWSNKLNKSQFIVGPMVDQSELPFRLLCRLYGAQLCYSPMLNAGIFVKDPKYRKENLISCNSDRPLIVQFCANDPEIFLEAARLAMPYCDAIDLNLGCPQTIAKRGHYGAFLEDEWDLLRSMITRVTEELNFPVTCKIRIFSDLDKTIKYAQMLEQSGCRLLAVHGRVKEQKGVLTGLANWQVIKTIKENVSIPVIANGNIQSLSDIYKCLQETSVDGIMSAEGVLHNPALFRGIHPPTWRVAEQYLRFVEEYPVALSIVRGHLFKFFHILLGIPENFDLRNLLAKANAREQLHQFVQLMKTRIRNVYSLTEDAMDTDILMSTLPLPPYFCQPHFRPPPPPKEEKSLPDEIGKKRRSENEPGNSNEAAAITAAKKIAREAQKNNNLINKRENSGRKLPLCNLCPNPKGVKCDYNLCRTCCRDKVFRLILDCKGHKLLFKTRRQLAIEREDKEKNGLTMDLTTTNTNSPINALACE